MIVWIDGTLTPERAGLLVSGPAFRCGMGVFETVLYAHGRLVRFPRHIRRMLNSLEALGIPHALPHPLDLEGIVAQVLAANALKDFTARVNLFCYQDAPEGPASLCVAAAPHVPAPEKGRSLATYPRAHCSHLCGHKTMANLHQRLAWDHARRAGADDALLQDEAGRVLETATANLVARDGDDFFTPATPFRLPGLTLEALSGLVQLREVEMTLPELLAMPYVYAVNSLIGIQTVIQIDDTPLEPDHGLCRRLRPALLEEP